MAQQHMNDDDTMHEITKTVVVYMIVAIAVAILLLVL